MHNFQISTFMRPKALIQILSTIRKRFKYFSGYKTNVFVVRKGCTELLCVSCLNINVLKRVFRPQFITKIYIHLHFLQNDTFQNLWNNRQA